ncbi:hypothetical protein WDD9_003660 [Paenibacillus melissococcoides]|nr:MULTISPECIES: hypothetical protein [Paenibacillus]GIO82714.1 hypothetical protein J6TS7_63240 [Paenibacillus dendritiformis]CAH8713781.1 hypothetical protein WDD9_003660 [Paenibacillus melissococcoides]CAH8720451.1 hypothetical protein HTL2_005947 [Paenibacillus melissococcoides]
MMRITKRAEMIGDLMKKKRESLETQGIQRFFFFIFCLDATVPRLERDKKAARRCNGTVNER